MSADVSHRRPWYLEIEFALLTALVVGVTVPRLTVLPLWGSEPLWALISRQMIDTGNYLVPMHDGLPFPDRPPLLSWGMIGAARLLGGFSLTAVRLPSVIALVATAWLIYGYSRQFLSPVGALAAGCAFPTMAAMLKFERIGQTDAVFTLWVTASLLLWHSGYLRQWPPVLTWALGWGCAALAALAKGPQGPVYFVGATMVLLVREGRWRYLFSAAHLVGILLFAAIVGAWLIPFAKATGWHAAVATFSEGGEIGRRFTYTSIRELLHPVIYPGVVLVSMLPWSMLLLPFIDGEIRRRSVLQFGRPLTFLVGACAVGFVPCWLAGMAGPRHFMAMFPTVAVLIGVATDLTWRAAENRWAAFRRYLLMTTALLIGLCGVAYGIAALVPGLQQPWLAPTPARAAMYALAAILAIQAVHSSMPGTSARAACAAVLGIAGFVGVSYVGPVLDGFSAIRPETREQTAAVRALVPADITLVSLGSAHDLFQYYYERPLEFRPWPSAAGDLDPSVRYFCYWQRANWPPVRLPFAWEPVATVACDWRRRATPEDIMIVGRRLDPR